MPAPRPMPTQRTSTLHHLFFGCSVAASFPPKPRTRATLVFHSSSVTATSRQTHLKTACPAALGCIDSHTVEPGHGHILVAGTSSPVRGSATAMGDLGPVDRRRGGLSLTVS